MSRSQCSYYCVSSVWAQTHVMLMAEHTHSRTYKAVLIKGARGLLISKTVFMDFNEARSGAGRNRIGAGIGIHPLGAN